MLPYYRVNYTNVFNIKNCMYRLPSVAVRTQWALIIGTYQEMSDLLSYDITIKIIITITNKLYNYHFKITILRTYFYFYRVELKYKIYYHIQCCFYNYFFCKFYGLFFRKRSRRARKKWTKINVQILRPSMDFLQKNASAA